MKLIRKIACSNSSQLVGIQAYGDFDKGDAGLMSKLVNLGVEPKHVVTKTAQEYLKGSTDIELSLDILETMYSFPHITDYLFVSGDSDLRHVIKRLKKHGKNLRLTGFEKQTSQFLIDIVNDFIPLDEHMTIIRKVTQSEKEQKSISLITNNFVQIIIEQMHKLQNDGRDFVGLNYIRRRLIDYYPDSAAEVSDALTDCIDTEVLVIYQVENPKDPKHPTRACKLNYDNLAVKYIMEDNQGK